MNGVGLSKPKSVDNNHNWLILLNFISEMRKIEMSPAQCRLQEVARYFLKGIGRFFTREPVHFHKNPREAIQEPLQRFCLSRFPIGVEPYRSAHSFKVHLLRLAADFHWHVNEPCFGHSAEEDGSAPLR